MARSILKNCDHSSNSDRLAVGLGGREEDVDLVDQAAGAGMVVRPWIPW